jgi:hypothetical protein
MVKDHHGPGCSAYEPVPGRLLIAHAAGGLQDRLYANSIEALDLSYAHGLRVFEMDFHELPFGFITAGHDPIDVLDPREARLSQVIAWMRRHHGTRLIVDMKTDNVRGLTRIAAEAPDLKARLTPFVYTNKEYDAVRGVGLSLPVYALFRHIDPDWLAFANTHAFAAVSVPREQFPQIPQIHHRVIVYTLDRLKDLVGVPVSAAVITNCMIPRSATPAPNSQPVSTR